MAEPKLRFKREDGTKFPEWEETLLQDISFYVTVTDVGDKSAFIGTENMKKECMGVLFDIDVDSEVKGVKFQANDILVSNIRPYLKKAWKADRNGICSTDVLCIRGNNDIDSDFLYTIISNDSFFDYVMQGAKGTKMPRGDKKHIMDMPVAIPCLEEQHKIAGFSSTFDEVIAQSEAEVRNLEQQKKAAMQKIFSQEVRFKREDGTEFSQWEEKTVNEVFEITRGYVLSTKLVKPYDQHYCYPVFSSQTKDNGLMGYYNDYLYENAITWTTDGANAGTVRFRNGRFYCTNVCGVLLNGNGYANQCIAEYLNSIAFKYVSHVGNPKLMNNVMAEIPILVPCLEEQQKIADFLSAYDEAIACAKQELDKWKELKKGLLQQMFV